MNGPASAENAKNGNIMPEFDLLNQQQAENPSSKSNRIEQLLLKIPLTCIEKPLLYQALFDFRLPSPYCEIQRFRLVLYSLLTIPNLNQEQKSLDIENGQIKELFRLLDSNQDGKLEIEEVASALRQFQM